MRLNQFLTGLGISTLFASAAMYLFGLWEVTATYQGFSFFSLGAFVLFTLAVYFVALAAVRSKSPTAFVQAIIGILAFKLFGAVLLILIYDRLFEPETRWFLLPFFTLYLIYTILETFLLMQMSKQKKTTTTA